MTAQTLNHSAFPSTTPQLSFLHLHPFFKLNQPFPSTLPNFSIILSHATSNSHTGPLNKKRSSSSSSSSTANTNNKNNKNKKNTNTHTNNNNNNKNSYKVLNDDVAPLTSDFSPPTSLPKPPAGFVVDDTGKLLTVSTHRLATLVDPINNRPLECVIRRVFTSTQGHECMLLCPVDMPFQILKSTGVGWSDVNDEELESILPAASYALAKIRMYLVYSGYCYTARGGFCYSEEDIFDFHPDGKEGGGLSTEGVEVTHFNLEGAHYMIYTPSDPLLFVVVKDQNGVLQIADDELLEDPAVTSAVDEETEFNALVEEEAALLDSLLGKR
ncbi:PREDICTED: probable serine/threonine-protein kinase samkB [Lupinus angustifolius]|uniref:probable serine/threonine-protein kinase samkB n=1 Tax=Lupinus angustifolius TaxID=3871 RepID=UPI00092E513D|nr:PREDICTED: probable serine/threonine-protein kinase samkB [Lupinus angustifolius]